jgi:hypothetical protein
MKIKMTINPLRHTYSPAFHVPCGPRPQVDGPTKANIWITTFGFNTFSTLTKPTHVKLSISMLEYLTFKYTEDLTQLEDYIVRELQTNVKYSYIANIEKDNLIYYTLFARQRLFEFDLIVIDFIPYYLPNDLNNKSLANIKYAANILDGKVLNEIKREFIFYKDDLFDYNNLLYPLELTTYTILEQHSEGGFIQKQNFAFDSISPNLKNLEHFDFNLNPTLHHINNKYYRIMYRKKLYVLSISQTTSSGTIKIIFDQFGQFISKVVDIKTDLGFLRKNKNFDTHFDANNNILCTKK